MTENPQKQLILTSIDYHLFHHALEKVKLPICNNKVKDYLIYLILLIYIDYFEKLDHE